MTKKRKNPHAPRKERIVTERGYFHTGNSGITISMIEDVQNYDWDEHDRDYFQHTLEIRHSAFGAPSTFQTPIAGPVMCDYYIQAFERLKQRMLANPRYCVGNPFDRYNHHRANDAHRVVQIADCLTREDVYGPEIVTDANSTSSALLGSIFINAEGQLVRAEAAPLNSGGNDSGSCGSGAPLYTPEQIGKPVPAKNVESDEFNHATVEQVACVLAKTFKYVGFMSGPVMKSPLNPGQLIAARSRKMVVGVDKYITAEEIAAQIADIYAGQDACYLYNIQDIVLPDGPRLDSESFDFEPKGWFPAQRSLRIRVGIEDDGKLNPVNV